MAQSPAKVIERFRKDLAEKAIRRAAVRALNKTATSVRAEAAKRVRKELAIKASDLKGEAIQIVKAKNQGLVSSFKASIVVKHRSLPLSLFSPRKRIVSTPTGKREGVSVLVKQSKGRKIVRDAFLIPTRASWAGNKGVAIREAGRRALTFLRTTSVAQLFSGKEFLDGLKEFIVRRTRTVLEQELKFEVHKARGD